MGVSTGAIKLFLELWQRGLISGVNSVIEMGAQALQVTPSRFHTLIRTAGITDYESSPFDDLINWPDEPKVSARHFYRLLGIDEYKCIDLNQAYGAIPHDLNLPIEDLSLFNEFDLVTDHGTNEHVFNIAETYRTLHRLCKPGGLILVMQSLYGGNGYHNFDLSFFEGMASANDYEILLSSFMVTITKQELLEDERMGLNPRWERNQRVEEFHIPLSNDLLDVVNWSNRKSQLGICYVFRKSTDQEFRYAYQGDFQSQVYGNGGYELQFLPDPPSRSYVPVHALTIDGLRQEVLTSISGKRLFKFLLHKWLRKYLKLGR